MSKPIILGVDTGGTFTDFVLFHDNNLTIHKVLSTPQNPAQAILQGIEDLQLKHEINAGNLLVIHGSTVATNAALEGKGVKTAYITNYGLKDLLHIGRQTRDELYNLQPILEPFPQPPQLCLETGGRIDAQGQVIEDLTATELEQLIQQIKQLEPQAVAINLLFSFLDDRFEKQIEQALPKHLFISRSSQVLPEYKEYERGVATWLNAWLGPIMQTYLSQLATDLQPSKLTIMQSSGGTMDAAHASRNAVRLLLSGPAGGLAAAQAISQQLNQPKLITFDMGGTSTDVSLINHGLTLTNESKIGRFPVSVAMVDIHTIGAGGGSIAYIDEGRILQVGPQSAGATPGPACYGRGGQQATVTDAHVVLGRLRPEYFLGGGLQLDPDAAHGAIAKLAKSLNLNCADTALGIIQIANEKMGRALREISVQRGHHPQDFSLCSFGGAAGLHACELAEALGSNSAIIPNNAGVLSAYGMIVAPKERHLSLTKTGLLANFSETEIDRALTPLRNQAEKELAEEGVALANMEVAMSLDLRYAGQSYTLNIPWRCSIAEAEEKYHQLHETRYGHRLETEVELVNVRIIVSAAAAIKDCPLMPSNAQNGNGHSKSPIENQAKPGQIGSATIYGHQQPIPIYERGQLAINENIAGPALIVEKISTTWLADNWNGYLDQRGNLILQHIKHEN